MSYTQRSANHKQLITMWNEKTKYPREQYIELATFQNAIDFLEEMDWFKYERK